MLRLLKNPTYLPIGKSRRRLRLLLSLLVACLIIPLLFLIRQTYVQLEKESHFLHRHSAENLVKQMNERAQEIIKFEDNRPIRDYFFLHLASQSSPAINFSPLSSHPPITATPGVIGYFQIHASGALASPLLPRDIYSAPRYGLTPSDIHTRMDVLNRMQSILTEAARVGLQRMGQSPGMNMPWAMELNRFFEDVDLDGTRPSWATDKMSDLKFHDPFPDIRSGAESGTGAGRPRRVLSRANNSNYIPILDPFSTPTEMMRSSSQQGSSLPWLPPAARSWPTPKQKVLRPDVEGSQNMKSSFSFRILPTGEGLFFRDVSVSGQRYIQGFLVEHTAFLKSVFERPLEASSLGHNTELWVGYRNVLLAKYSPYDESSPPRGAVKDSEGLLVLSAGLMAPFDGFELLFSTHLLPDSPAKPVVTTLALIVILVLILGVYLIYGLALNQLEFAKQRNDFVSAVSHELKTPLTSIRMYGEMLRDGWIQDDTKKKSYYDYIFFESERLSRLISNVLYLTRYTNDTQPTKLKRYTPDGVLSFVETKVASMLQVNNFTLELTATEEQQRKAANVSLEINEDAISQIFINLVDNAIKFSKPEGLRKVDLGYRISGTPANKVTFFVRDYGPGVPREDREKIFKLFFRSGDEMTRTTSGTGMGLALVKQMAVAMDAEVSYRAAQPGSEFRLEIKIDSSPQSASKT